MAAKQYPQAHHPLFYAALQDALTVPEACARLAANGTPYNPRTVRRWCEEGRIAAHKNKFGYWLLSHTSLTIFLRISGRTSQSKAA